MAQISYWKTVRQLYEIYEYNCNNTIIENMEELIKKSIKEFIQSYYFHKTEEEIYMELNIIRNSMDSIESAMIQLGQKWYEED